MIDIDSVGTFNIAEMADTSIDNEIIYLKIVNGNVEAYGDLDSIEPDEGTSKKKSYDKMVSVQEWNAAGNAARVVDGEIVLGRSPEEKLILDEERIRAERDFLLKDCDAVSPMRWNAMTKDEQQAWMNYRQALLDIPQQSGFPWDGDPDKVPWPKEPE